jgi:hypothetical protein
MKDLTKDFDSIIIDFLRSDDENATNLAVKLNDFVHEELKNCNLQNVSQQRELLIGLLTKLENGGGNTFIDKEQIVDDYLKAN